MFREKIKGAMYEQGVSMAQLSRRTLINSATISSFLKGSRAISNDNLDKILQELGLTLVPKAAFVFKQEETCNDNQKDTQES